MAKTITIKKHTLSSDKVCICVPVVSSDRDSIINDVKKCVEKSVPVVELRADFFECLNNEEELINLLKDISDICQETITLFTIRTSDEGGNVTISENDFRRILLAVSSSGYVDMVDCEIDKIFNAKLFFERLHENGVKIVSSHHNFSKTYDEEKIKAIYDVMYKSDADIVKIALMPNSKKDTLTMMMASNDFSQLHEDVLLVAITMGELGKPTRVCSSYVGSCITFASIEKASAPGQIGFDEMSEVLNILGY